MMSYKILIVDDSATTRAMIKRVINMSQMPVGEILEASDGKSALMTLFRTPVDLVLLDLNMPQMDGLEVTRRMRDQESMRKIPIVVVSAEPNAADLDQLKGEKTGIQAVVHKPFTPEIIREVISRVMGAVHV